jgi:hypothetical protein
VLSSAFATGSASIFRAYTGVRNEVANRLREREDAASNRPQRPLTLGVATRDSNSTSTPTRPLSRTRTGTSPMSPAQSTTPVAPQLTDIQATLGGIGKGIGSFFGSRMANIRGGAASVPDARLAKGLRPMTLRSTSSMSAGGAGDGTPGSTETDQRSSG